MKDVIYNIEKDIHKTHTFILWHYIRGSIYDTPYWRAAQKETTAIFKQPNEDFKNMLDFVKSMDYIDLKVAPHSLYGLWLGESIKRWYDGYII